jgi:NADH:ubiquinone oxidoreductase subunit 5 (subunit L)/multisubunit Na+/H+ antiporter MnhA subunit
MIIPIVFSVLILSAISYLAISRRSSLKIRLAALVALAAMIITVIICLFRIFMTPAAAQVQQYPDMPVPEAAPASPNIMALVLFIVILLALFLVILFLSLREQRQIANVKEEIKFKLDF